MPDPIYDLKNLFTPRGLVASAAIGVSLVVVAGAFAFTGGWLSPHRLTQDRIVDEFQAVNGLHPGFRRNHPKGICFTGQFESNGAGERLSKADVFKPGRTPVFGRFAIASGQPYAPDTAASVYSMAVDFELTDGEIWRTGMNDIPVFPVDSAKAFYELLQATAPDPKSGKPDPDRVKAFFGSHPKSAKAIQIVGGTPLASGFANATYNSLNAFIFTNAQGQATPVRWSMVAEDAFDAAKPEAGRDPNYHFDDLETRLRREPIRWKLVVTSAGAGDATNDATAPWPPDREHVEVGVLTVDHLDDEAHGACRDVTFDPLMLPNGIAGSDDPILSARSAAYASSYLRRSGEPAPTPGVPLSASIESAH